eukprot:scaffold47149_cov75-Phaeocystis_antarctica.AAC.4
MLDKSKLSGWLKATASCPVTHGGALGRDMRGERREGVGRWRCKQSACTGETNWTLGRLVERARALPSHKAEARVWAKRGASAVGGREPMTVQAGRKEVPTGHWG